MRWTHRSTSAVALKNSDIWDVPEFARVISQFKATLEKTSKIVHSSTREAFFRRLVTEKPTRECYRGTAKDNRCYYLEGVSDDIWCQNGSEIA